MNSLFLSQDFYSTIKIELSPMEFSRESFGTVAKSNQSSNEAWTILKLILQIGLRDKKNEMNKHRFYTRKTV